MMGKIVGELQTPEADQVLMVVKRRLPGCFRHLNDRPPLGRRWIDGPDPFGDICPSLTGSRQRFCCYTQMFVATASVCPPLQNNQAYRLINEHACVFSLSKRFRRGNGDVGARALAFSSHLLAERAERTFITPRPPQTSQHLASHLLTFFLLPPQHIPSPSSSPPLLLPSFSPSSSSCQSPSSLKLICSSHLLCCHLHLSSQGHTNLPGLPFSVCSSASWTRPFLTLLLLTCHLQSSKNRHGAAERLEYSISCCII